jgi:hypothetical protein
MLIDDCLDSYYKASQEQKTKIAQEIVGVVHHAGGRFFKDDGAGWAQVTNIHVLRQRWPVPFVAYDRKSKRSLLMLPKKSRTP